MKTIINKDIANQIGKSEQTVRAYKVNNPNLLELLRIGMLCKKNNLSETDIKKLLELKESFIGSDTKLLN